MKCRVETRYILRSVKLPESLRKPEAENTLENSVDSGAEGATLSGKKTENGC